jgi:hypothetical protein
VSHPFTQRSGVAMAALASIGVLASCGTRASSWDRAVDTTQAPYALANGVALVDDVNHQVVVFESASDHTLSAQGLPLGHHFASATPSADGASLLMLSSGDWPLVDPSDDPPSLTVLAIDGTKQAASGTFPATATRFGMSQPLPTLSIDPLGTYAVAYQGGTMTPAFATNPNEIVIFDLTKPPGPNNPVARTLQSFGSSPQRLTFSPTMLLPAGAVAAGVTATPRRLLVVETDIDVTMVDLTHAFDLDPVTKLLNPPPDITVRLTDGTNATPVTPAGVAIDPNENDGRLALRTQEDRNVYTIQLVPTPPAAPGTTGPMNDFTPSLNLTDVGGIPSDIEFVSTIDGLRVAALVPSASQAVLVEPDTSETTAVALAAPYSNLSLVTNIVTAPGSTSSTDVAMLWQQSRSANDGASGVALWTLGDAVGQPYRSVEVLTVEDPIASVIDVPNSNLKVLTTPTGSTHALYVLDLARRTPSPINTTATPTLSMAPDGSKGPDGGRFWAYENGGTDLAYINLKTLNTIPLTTTSPISSVFDIGAPSAPGGKPARTLVAFDAQGTFGATVFDALAPQTATSQHDVALLLEAP